MGRREIEAGPGNIINHPKSGIRVVARDSINGRFICKNGEAQDNSPQGERRRELAQQRRDRAAGRL